MKYLSLSRITLLLLAFTGLFVFFAAKLWKTSNVIQYDPFNYYVYLPATFIKHDISLKFIESEKEVSPYKTLQLNNSPLDKRYTKMSMGMAFMYSPFFAIAHIVAPIRGAERDGFSKPYQFFLRLSGLIYAFLGLVFLRIILLRYFSEGVVSLTLISISIGTNLAYYVIYEPMMSHPANFFLFAVFILLTIKWHENTSYKNTIFLSIIGGLIILIRPSNIIILLFPVLLGMKSLNERMDFFLRHKFKIFFSGLVVFSIFIPQMLYWKMISGNYIYYAYQNEHFYFLHPHLIDGLFGYRKGWLLYTPMMALALVGLVILKNRIGSFFYPVILFVVINIWIVLSWWCWWYGGSFGLRAFIESYVILSFPLACIYERAYKHIYSGLLVSALIVLLCKVNLFQTEQAHTTQIHWDSMSKRVYWDNFMTKTWSKDRDKYLIHPDFDHAGHGEPEVTKEGAP